MTFHRVESTNAHSVLLSEDGLSLTVVFRPGRKTPTTCSVYEYIVPKGWEFVDPELGSLTLRAIHDGILAKSVSAGRVVNGLKASFEVMTSRLADVDLTSADARAVWPSFEGS